MKNLKYFFSATGIGWVCLFSMNSCIDPGIKNNNLPEPASFKSDSIGIRLELQTDTSLYRKRMVELANGDQSGRWPPKVAQPMAGSVVPFNRVVAFYGNFYSKKMGILGALPAEKMLDQLKQEVESWAKADARSPVIPAIHYIAVSAQNKPGPAGKYRMRMPFHQIDKALSIAKTINGIVFLDIQVGLSTLEEELPELDKYLSLPEVHLGIDPEYSMKNGSAPGTVVGAFDAADINFASAHLAKLVAQHRIPPKMLVVHRFTTGMLTNYKNIVTRPEVQLIINMDGFGFPALKKNSFYHTVHNEPVQFAGFKLFYKNDTVNGNHLMKPEEILKLIPQPVYIQYQ